MPCCLPAKDGSHTGSGGKHDYEMESGGGSWQIEREANKGKQDDVENAVQATPAASETSRLS